MKIYFASPLFSEMELNYNKMVVDNLRSVDSSLDIYLPQENMALNDKNAYANSLTIAKGDTDYLKKSDVMIAILDGATIDDGVCAEIGVAFSEGIPVIGVYTDSRQKGSNNQKKLDALSDIAESQFPYINLYVVGLIKENGIIIDHSSKIYDELIKYKKKD